MYRTSAPITGVVSPINVYSNKVNDVKLIMYMLSFIFRCIFCETKRNKTIEINAKIKILSIKGRICIVFTMSQGNGLNSPLSKPIGIAAKKSRKLLLQVEFQNSFQPGRM